MRLFYLFLFETRNKFSYDIVKYFIHRKRKRFLVNRFIWSQLNIYIYDLFIIFLFCSWKNKKSDIRYYYFHDSIYSVRHSLIRKKT